MAIVTIAGGLWIPAPLVGYSGAAPAFIVTHVIDASNERYFIVFQAPKAGTLKGFGIRLGNVAQAPASGLRLSWQDVDTNGNADGTADQYRVVTAGLSANAWVDSGIVSSDGTDGGTKRTVTQGEYVAAAIDFASFATGDSVAVASLGSDGAQASMGQSVYARSGAATPLQLNQYPILAVQYDDDSYPNLGPTVIPATAVTSLSVTTATNPDEVGLKFSLPVAATLDQVWVRNAPGNNADYQIVLYSASDVALATLSVDEDAMGGSNHKPFRLPTTVTLSASTTYRLVVKPTTTNGMTVYNFDVNAAALMAAVGGGTDFVWTERTDGGSWTDVTTKRPFMGLGLAAVETASTSGGGEVSHVFVG